MTAWTITKDSLPALFEALSGSYRVIGPMVRDGAVVLDEIVAGDLPLGRRERQAPGRYRLLDERDGRMFSFSNGPDSFKRFLNPPVTELYRFRRSAKKLTVDVPMPEEKPIALFGMRACDRAALKLYDKVFLGGPVKIPDYAARRNPMLLIALTCVYPGDNCFCSSIGTGPEVTGGFDILITELDDRLLIETGSRKGDEITALLSPARASGSDLDEKMKVVEKCRSLIGKSIPFRELPQLIYRNLDHPRWAEIARRDLECGNCTQVCPTCFCTTAYDSVGLGGVSGGGEISGSHVRTWDSCFSRNFARVHGGNFRVSRRARYRHWMAHKLAYALDQFDLPGCVGCGRCITWCPAGIDITAELEALSHAR